MSDQETRDKRAAKLNRDQQLAKKSKKKGKGKFDDDEEIDQYRHRKAA